MNNTSIAMTNTETGIAQCMHGVGIGKAGCDSLVEMITRGQIEDLLVSDSRTTFAALAVDIGDKELKGVRRAAEGLRQRLSRRGVSDDRILVTTYNMKPPVTPEEEDAFYGSLMNVREYLKIEFPRQYWNPNYEPWVNSDDDVIPKEGEHTYRVMAKALYYDHYYRLGLKQEVAKFCRFITETEFPSIVYMFFGMAGGCGSGVAVDMARHLSNVHFGRRIALTGFAYLPCFKDGDRYYKSAACYAAMTDIEAQINQEANDGVIAVWGDLMRNPWTGGFFVVPREPMAVRTRVIDQIDNMPDSVKGHRFEGSAQITDRTVNLTLVDFLTTDASREFIKAATPTGVVRWTWTEANNGERSWNAILITQFIHAAAEVMPTNNSKGLREETMRYMKSLKDFWRFEPKFKTDFINAGVYGSATTLTDPEVKKVFEDFCQSLLIEKDNYKIDFHTAYDEANSWITAVIPGISIQDMTDFIDGRAAYDALDEWVDRLHVHSYVLDLGPMICEPSIRSVGLAGECIWGCACWIVYPHKKLRGEGEYPKYRPERWDELMSGMENATIKPGDFQKGGGTYVTGSKK